MPSNRSMPVETRAAGAAWSRPSEEIGRTEMPCSSMRNGYSFVPWVDPRYLTTRRRRVEISSRIRWSSTITQSETNSSMPCRVSLSGRSRSAVMTVVNSFCLSQPNRRRISARRIPGFGISPKSASMVSRTIRRAPTLWTASAIRMKRPSRSYSPVSPNSLRVMDTWSTNSFFSATSRSRSNLDRLVAEKKLFVDHVSITRSEFGETGEYDLEGLFIRIADAVQRVGARRVVLDTLEALFGELPNPGILRAEIRRLLNWLKQKGLTTVITAERDQPDKLTRHGIEEFVSDCVILLDHRIREEISTRRLRIVKYRGSAHGTNEYPFLIDDQGISVLPISSLT